MSRIIHIVFGEPRDMEDGTKFVKISARRPNGDIIPFIVKTPLCATSGVKKSRGHGSVSYRLPVVLYRKHNGEMCPTEEQHLFEIMIRNTICMSRNWIVDNDDLVDLPDVDYEDEAR